MSALSQAELYKYPKNTSRDRVSIFLNKLIKNEPFELNNGQKVVLKFQQGLYEALEKRQNLRSFVLLDTKGKTYKFSDLKKTSEFGGTGGAGQGAGAEITELTESAQALYAAARWKNTKDYSESDLKKAQNLVDISENISNILTKLPPVWRESCVLGAERLHQEFGRKSYTFHRQSNWVKKLETHFKKLNGKSGKYFSNVNKWSPADIWLVSEAGKRIDLTKTDSLVELNTVLKEALDTGDIIGVSLKQIVGKVKFSYVNYGPRNPPVRYEGYIVSKRNFWGSKDIYINYSIKGEMQFRTFTAGASSWQGEVKGEHASHGKVSYGLCERFLKQLKVRDSLPNALKLKKDFENLEPKILNHFWNLYRKYDEKDNPKLKFDQFIEEYNKKGEDKTSWGFSKYLGLLLLDIIITEKVEDGFVGKAVEYATSTSELSAPFAKME